MNKIEHAYDEKSIAVQGIRSTLRVALVRDIFEQVHAQFKNKHFDIY